MRTEEREQLLAAYALGTLSAPDAADVEELLRHDASASEELASYYEIVELIALSVPMRRADPSLRDRVLSAARRESTRRALSPGARIRKWLPAAAVAAVVLTVGVWAVNLQQSLVDLQRESALLTAIVESDAKRLDALSDAGQVAASRSVNLETKLNEAELLAAVMLDPKVLTVPLEPTAAAHGAGGSYLWSVAADAGVLRVHDLQPLPFGSVYRVLVEDRFGQVVADDSFRPDDQGSATRVLEGETGQQPLRITVIATANGASETVDGPVVLKATITANDLANPTPTPAVAPTATATPPPVEAPAARP